MTHYALDAANRMIAILDDEHAGPLGLGRALAIGCATLKRLEKDLQNNGPFRRDLERLARDYGNGHLEPPTSSFQTFAETFIQFEKNAMKKAGASSQLISFMFEDVELVLDGLKAREFSPETTKTRVQRLRQSICSISEALVLIAQSADRNARLRRNAKRALHGVAGGGIMVANASADAVTTLGLAPWMTVISAGVGGAMLGLSIGDGGIGDSP